MATPYRQLHWLYLVFVNCWLLLQPSFLCADWTMGTIPLITSIFDLRNLITILTFLSLGLLSVYSVTRVSSTAKAVVLSLALMIFPFLPASNLFFPVGFVVAERVLYLPSMGFCMLVSLGCWHLIHKKSCILSKLATIFLFSLILLHSAKTLRRNKDWRSDRDLFLSAIAINPHNGKLYNNLGHEHEAKQEYETAERLFRMAIMTQPDDVGAYINLGRALRALGRDQEAEKVCSYSLRLIGNEVQLHSLLALNKSSWFNGSLNFLGWLELCDNSLPQTLYTCIHSCLIHFETIVES